CQQHYNYPSTF
nr:immunoglobulin light chain junction region [Macaca mulatta]MOW40102.1 immunoglobulin light chain junction region [Macaca mulatta]